MRTIKIDNDIIKISLKYYNMIVENMRDEVLCKLNEIINEYETLKKDKCKIKKDKNTEERLDPALFVGYLQLLLREYDNLQTMLPSEFVDIEKEFGGRIPIDKINCKIWNEEKRCWGDSLSARIIKAMKFDKVRKEIYPIVIRDLNIKTCVYCNANYTISDSKGNAYFDLDHWKPKSYYPYLCTTFFNLQPSCPSCNRRKGNDTNKYFRIWSGNTPNAIDIFRFQLEPESIIKYLYTRDAQQLSLTINENSSAYKKLVNVAKKRFNLDYKYKEHMDVVEEIVWKHQIYNDAYLFATQTLLQNIRGICGDDYKSARDRFIIGNYCDPEDVHKRPLSKMTQDIGRQLGIL